MRLNTTSIQDIVGGDLVVAPADVAHDLLGLTWDSREVFADCLYAALPGERVDGNDFIACAIEGGAMLALAGRVPDERTREVARKAGAGIIVVDDVAESITALASVWRSMISATVVAITGSVGKTTTKSLTRQILSSHFKTCATKGNFNNELGAPYTVLSADSDCEMLIVEMGMDDLGQIAHICSFARPDMGLINNVGVSHLERLGTRENIARAKAELFEALPEGGKAFVNNADDMADFVCELGRLDERGVETILFDGTGAVPGAAGARAVWAQDISVDDEGRPHFTLCARGFDSCSDEQSVPCALGLRGIHNVSNACGAAAIGLACGLSLESVACALADAEPEAGRQEVKRASSGAVVFDDSYNASPASMRRFRCLPPTKPPVGKLPFSATWASSALRALKGTKRQVVPRRRPMSTNLCASESCPDPSPKARAMPACPKIALHASRMRLPPFSSSRGRLAAPTSFW